MQTLPAWACDLGCNAGIKPPAIRPSGLLAHADSAGHGGKPLAAMVAAKPPRLIVAPPQTRRERGPAHNRRPVLAALPPSPWRSVRPSGDTAQ